MAPSHTQWSQNGSADRDSAQMFAAYPSGSSPCNLNFVWTVLNTKSNPNFQFGCAKHANFSDGFSAKWRAPGPWGPSGLPGNTVYCHMFIKNVHFLVGSMVPPLGGIGLIFFKVTLGQTYSKKLRGTQKNKASHYFSSVTVGQSYSKK